MAGLKKPPPGAPPVLDYSTLLALIDGRRFPRENLQSHRKISQKPLLPVINFFNLYHNWHRHLNLQHANQLLSLAVDLEISPMDGVMAEAALRMHVRQNLRAANAIAVQTALSRNAPLAVMDKREYQHIAPQPQIVEWWKPNP